MFTSQFRWIIGPAIVLFTLSVNDLPGQYSNQDQGLLQKQSLNSYENGDYRTALEGYRSLLENYPRNGMYRYYAGICLVQLNEDLDEAIEYLYAASNQNVPRDVNYYLARAYHLEYNFAEAQKYYGRYEMDAGRQEVREKGIKQLIRTCRSAREITATYNPYEVMNVTFIDLKDSTQFTQVRMKGGRLQKKAAEYFTGDEDREDLNSLMFMPKSVSRGDYIYFTGYNRSGKGGAQLYRMKRGTARAWSDPEEIKALNSDGDEILPYFDPIESDLYFASDGRDGIGGFDLYRSHYDSKRDTWSEPINLGFPINSAMDDYLALPGSDLGMIMFFSSRQGTDSTIAVYRVHLLEPKKKTDANNTRMLKEIASLGGAAEDILADMEQLAMVESEPQGGPVNETAGSKEPERPREYTRVKVVSESDERSEYQLALAEALEFQARSDSLKDLATAARVRVRDSEDPNDRWVWQKQIMVWEKKARDEEEKADLIYAGLSDKKTADTRRAPGTKELPETIEVDRQQGDLTVYRYKPVEEKNSSSVTGPAEPTNVSAEPTNVSAEPTNVSAEPTKVSAGITKVSAGPVTGEPGTQPSARVETVAKIPESPAPSHNMNRFQILPSSPYNQGNPIPLDVSIPDGSFYRIQLGAFGNAVEPGTFQGISPVTGERNAERGIIKYYAGKFNKYQDASDALSRVRSAGYEDAFIVAWYNGSPISTQRAKQLE